LGGTFDPVHIGHLRIAEEIGEDLALDKVFLVPGGHPPHKNNDRITPFADRLAMARLAIEDAERLDVLDLEGRRQGRSYSIETLQELKKRFPPEEEFFFLIGTDAFWEIKTWKDYEKLFDYAHFVVFRRPGFQEQKLGRFLNTLDIKLKKSTIINQYRTESDKTITFKEVTTLDISSTSIRSYVGQGRSIRFLVTDPVRDYILKRGLYRPNGDT